MTKEDYLDIAKMAFDNDRKFDNLSAQYREMYIEFSKATEERIRKLYNEMFPNDETSLIVEKAFDSRWAELNDIFQIGFINYQIDFVDYTSAYICVGSSRVNNEEIEHYIKCILEKWDYYFIESKDEIISCFKCLKETNECIDKIYENIETIYSCIAKQIEKYTNAKLEETKEFVDAIGSCMYHVQAKPKTKTITITIEVPVES